MEKSFVAALYPRFGGMYYSIRYLDFDDQRGPNVDPQDINNIQLMQVGLQAVIDERLANGKSIPEPQLEKYSEFVSVGSIGDVHYVKLKVRVTL
jgi:hypothetical protein